MSHLVMLAYVPVLLLGSFGVVVLVCRAAGAVEREQERQARLAEVERRRSDAEFAGIVAASLADLQDPS